MSLLLLWYNIVQSVLYYFPLYPLGVMHGWVKPFTELSTFIYTYIYNIEKGIIWLQKHAQSLTTMNKQNDIYIYIYNEKAKIAFKLTKLLYYYNS